MQVGVIYLKYKFMKFSFEFLKNKKSNVEKDLSKTERALKPIDYDLFDRYTVWGKIR